jgi:hypothetical protein
LSRIRPHVEDQEGVDSTKSRECACSPFRPPSRPRPRPPPHPHPSGRDDLVQAVRVGKDALKHLALVQHDQLLRVRVRAHVDDPVHVQVKVFHFRRLGPQSLPHALLHRGIQIHQPPKKLRNTHHHDALTTEGRRQGAVCMIVRGSVGGCARVYALRMPLVDRELASNTSRPSFLRRPTHLAFPRLTPTVLNDGDAGERKACVPTMYNKMPTTAENALGLRGLWQLFRSLPRSITLASPSPRP